ncbi:MAG: hypothetical protein GXY03_14280 [Solirubrobacterales bacterium]|nr:hypothetical protein [Solirubrobacterales bacterium]
MIRRPALRPRRLLLAALATVIAALGVAVPPAGAVEFNGVTLSGREVAPSPAGYSRAKISWRFRCSGENLYAGVVLLYSYEAGRAIVPITLGLPSEQGSRVTHQLLGPGRYKPQIVGAACADTTRGEAAQGPETIDGPDFVVCRGTRGLPAVALESRAGWPLVPVDPQRPKRRQPGCASDEQLCDASAAAAGGRGWPVIPVPSGCVPKCSGGGASAARSGWPVVPVRQRCAPERLRKNKVDMPVDCPGGATGSRRWPVVAVPCRGSVRMETAKPAPCAAAAGRAWPVVPVGRCAAVRRGRAVLGRSRFKLGAGEAGLVPVKLARRGVRTIRRQKRMRVRATLTVRQGKRRTRTVRTFTVRAR